MNKQEINNKTNLYAHKNKFTMHRALCFKFSLEQFTLNCTAVPTTFQHHACHSRCIYHIAGRIFLVPVDRWISVSCAIRQRSRTGIL